MSSLYSFKSLYSFIALATMVTMAGFASGCEATIGPYVSDIRQQPNGDLLVIRCTTTVTRTGNMDSYEQGNCTKTVLPYPQRTAVASSPPDQVTLPPENAGTLIGP